MMMVDESVLRELKRLVSSLIDDVEEIGKVEDDISEDDILDCLKKINVKVNEVIVDEFMGDDDE
jgi:hypothetical protein